MSQFMASDLGDDSVIYRNRAGHHVTGLCCYEWRT